MRYSLLFAAVLILVSGFIAYFGDLLGRYMGKKRLTLLRMRPRHTAYAVTAVTGMLIATLTLSTLISVNQDFNRLWTEGDRIIATNKRLTKTNKLLAAQSKALDARIKTLQGEVDQAEEERLKAVEAEMRAVEAQKKAALAVQRLEKDIAARQRQVETQKKQLAELKMTSDTTKRDLRAKTAELAGRQADLTRTRTALSRARGLQDKAEDDLRLATAKLTDTQTAVAQKEAALRVLEAQLADSQKALVEEGAKRLKFEQQASELLGGDIRFRQGDEIFRGTVSPRQSLFSIKGDLYSILDAAGDKAAKQGAAEGPNGRAVALPQYVVDGGKSITVTESEWVSQIADTIAQGRLTAPDTLVRVVCIGNSLVGEQTPVRLVLHYNNLVYPEGKLIAETRINGRLSEGRVLLAVVNFLQNEVSVAGLNAGIVPVSNPDPRASLGSDPKTQVDGLMSVVDLVKAQGTWVKVQAYARTDIYAIGPLSMTNMSFTVTKGD